MNKSSIQEISIHKLIKSKYQPRKTFDPEEIALLAKSIQNHGLLQPAVVRAIRGKEEFEIIAGERRCIAAKHAGLDTVACLISDFSDEQAATAAVVENTNRVNLTPIEEAETYKSLIDEFMYSHEELGALVGKSRAKITNLLRLLTLDKRVVNLIENNTISESMGKIIAGTPKDHHFTIAFRCIKNNYSVRQLEKYIKNKKAHTKSTLKNHNKDDSYLLSKLSEHLQAQVKLHHNSYNGYIKIEFNDLKTLNGILERVGLNINED